MFKVSPSNIYNYPVCCPSGSTGSIGPHAITPGSSYQILHTNFAATAAEWTTDLPVPGDLDVSGSSSFTGNGLFLNDLAVQNDFNVNSGDCSINTGELLVLLGDSTLQSLDVGGNLSFNSVSGSPNQYLKKTSPSTQAFSNIIASDITASSDLTVLTSAGGIAQWLLPTPVNRIVFGTSFDAQNINQVGPSPALFSTLPFINLATSTGSPITGISQPSVTEFLIGTAGNYLCDISGYIDSASTGLGNSVVTLSIEVAGIESQRSCVTCNANYSFSGTISFLAAAGQIVRVLLRRVVGTGTLLTHTLGSPLPNYASSIIFRLF